MDRRILDALRLVRDTRAFGGAAYSANVGDIPMADGGEVVERSEWNPLPGLKIKPPAEKLSDEPDIREYQLARHAHEFEGAPEPTVPKRKVILDAPLLGGKKELGELPYDYQPIVQKALNLIYGQKTLPLYENPLTALLGRAIDAYETAKFIQRDPTDLTNYTGVPGVVYGAGKLAAPAIGAGAGAAVASDEERPVARDPEIEDAMRIAHKSGGGAWTRKEGQNPEGGLNAKGRAAAKREGHNLKPPAPHPKTERDAARRRSFCARMSGMKAKLTSAKTAKDPDSRINKSLRAWNCADGGVIDEALDLAQRKSGGKAVWNKPRPKGLGESEPLSSSQKASAKARAKAAGRPYPNLVDNMAAARAEGGRTAHDFVQDELKTGEPVLRQYDPQAGLATALDFARFIPGAGAVKAVGLYPDGNGGYLPSLKEDLEQGHPLDAVLDAVGLAVPSHGAVGRGLRFFDVKKPAKKKITNQPRE